MAPRQTVAHALVPQRTPGLIAGVLLPAQLHTVPLGHCVEGRTTDVGHPRGLADVVAVLVQQCLPVATRALAHVVTKLHCTVFWTMFEHADVVPPVATARRQKYQAPAARSAMTAETGTGLSISRVRTSSVGLRP